MKAFRTMTLGAFAIALLFTAGGMPDSILAQAPESDASQTLPANVAALISKATEDWEALYKRLLKDFPNVPPDTGEIWFVSIQANGRGGTYPFPVSDPDRCIGVPGGADVMEGYVVRLVNSTMRPGSVQYDGMLLRETNQALCEVQETSDGERWCAGSLMGRSLNALTILLPTDNNGSHYDGEVRITPFDWNYDPTQWGAHVGGKCTSLDNLAAETGYFEEFRLDFETLEPTGLTNRGYLQSRTDNSQESQYKMIVRKMQANDDNLPRARHLVALVRKSLLHKKVNSMSPNR